MGRAHGTNGSLTLSGTHGFPIPTAAATGEIKSYSVDFAGDLEQDMEFGSGDGHEKMMRGMHSATGSFEAWYTSEEATFATFAKVITDAPGSATTDGTMVLTLDTGNTVTFPCMLSNCGFEHTRTGFCIVRGEFQSSGVLT